MFAHGTFRRCRAAALKDATHPRPRSPLPDPSCSPPSPPCSKWLVPRDSLMTCQAEDRAKGLSEPQLQQLKGHFTQCE